MFGNLFVALFAQLVVEQIVRVLLQVHGDFLIFPDFVSVMVKVASSRPTCLDIQRLVGRDELPA